MARGLHDAGPLVGVGALDTAEVIRRRSIEACRPSGRLTKFVPGDVPVSALDEGNSNRSTPGSAVAGHERAGRGLDPDAIDGSALLVLGGFGPFHPGSDTVRETLRAVDASLVVDGGVHRYLGDEYFGGGLWIVLGGALALVLADRDPRRSARVLDWIEAQADASGHLPEQVATSLRVPEGHAAWVERWGPPAQPLLWSHAMYLLAVAALEL